MSTTTSNKAKYWLSTTHNC